MSGTHVGELDLRHIRDRVEAVGGTLAVTESAGRTLIDLAAPASPDGLAAPPHAVPTAALTGL